MPGSQWPAWLLIAGLALIGIGVVVAVVVMTLVLVRRQRAAVAAEPRLGGAFGETGTGTSDRGASPTDGTADPESGSSGGLEHLFVASPADAPRPAPHESQPVARLEPGGPAASPAETGWGDIIAAETSHSYDVGYTTSSFAPPGHLLSGTPSVSPRPDAAPQPIVEPAPPAELTSPPLANPWVGTGPQPPAGPSSPAPGAPPAAPEPPAPSPAASPSQPAPEPAAPPSPPAPEPTAANSTETVPTIAVEHIPLAHPAAPPAPGDRETVPESFAPIPRSGEDEDRTVLVGDAKRAPWLLILDTGERIAIPAESVVLGRKPAAIEHGVPGVVVPDATKTVSKVHARIDRSGEHWTITDLGSTNGCSIIEPGGREKLLPGGGSEVVRGRFLLGEVGMILVRNPEGPGQ